jgi:hypothetical protein
MKRFLEHGRYRMMEILKHPSVLGETMPPKFWKMLEDSDIQNVKDFFYEHITEDKIRELESLKFKLDNWGAKK